MILLWMKGKGIMDKKTLNEKIGIRIRNRREELNYTREKIAERANISVQFLFDIEKGKKSMTALTIINLAKALSISIDYLLLGTRETDMCMNRNLEKILAPLIPEQRELAEEMLKLFVRGINTNCITNDK